MRIRNQRDFWAGVMFVAFGGFVAGMARNYELGTAAEMGPGYFPSMLGMLLMFLGLFVVASGLSPKRNEETVERFYFGTMFFILVPVVTFGLLVEFLGLVPSLLVLVVFASLASPEFKFKEALKTAVVLITLSLVIFIWGLDMHMRLWPSFD